MARVLVFEIVGLLGLLLLFGLWENSSESDGVYNLRELKTVVDDIGEELQDTLARIQGTVNTISVLGVRREEIPN